MACAWLVEAGDDAVPPIPAGLKREVQPSTWRAVARLSRNERSPVSTSAGRLFDAVAALCGLRARVTYEGQAAIELEAASDPAAHGAYPFAGLDPRPAIRAVAADLAAGATVGLVAARFHEGLAAAVAGACAKAADDAGTGIVALSGGVFQNRRLLTATAGRLERAGLRVLIPARLPPNDGGISYGQAAVAAALGA
jgi:hydrogenase maturation protein HypF